MKKRDIEAIFTAKVQDYIVKGYTISTTTMSGHQGEIAKVDVTNGSEIIRILLTSEHEWNHEDFREIESVVLTVGRAEETYKPSNHSNPFDTMRPTIWNNKLEILEQRTFYQISRNDDFFTEDFAEYRAMQEVQMERMRRADRSWAPKTTELGEAAKQVAIRYIKRKLGKSRVSSKDVKVIKKEWKDETHYYIAYFSKEYRLA